MYLDGQEKTRLVVTGTTIITRTSRALKRVKELRIGETPALRSKLDCEFSNQVQCMICGSQMELTGPRRKPLQKSIAQAPLWAWYLGRAYHKHRSFFCLEVYNRGYVGKEIVSGRRAYIVCDKKRTGVAIIACTVGYATPRLVCPP